MPYAFSSGITQAEAKAACKSALTDHGYTSAVSAFLNTSISSRAAETGIVGHVKSALTSYGFNSAVSAFIDTAISSRAIAGDLMGLSVAGKTAVQSALTTQGLTSARATKLDKLDTTVSSRAIESGIIAHVQTGLTNQGFTAARSGYLDNITKDIEDATGSLVMNGTELVVKEFTSLTQRMDCFLDLSVLQAADTVVLKQYMKIKSGGTYRSFGTATYTGVQTDPLVYIDIKPAKYGFKVSLQQTGGTNRTVDWQTFKQVKSG